MEAREPPPAAPLKLPASCSLAQALQMRTEQRVSRLERLMLLEALLGKPREYLIAHDEDILDETCLRAFETLLQKRSAGHPMAYLTGSREFFGLRFAINDQVLIPRPETEWLVQAAIRILPEEASAIDLGTGSGAIAIALAFHRPDAKLIAADISQSALTLAEHNAGRLLGPGHPLQFCKSNWWASIPMVPFALVLSNPPYLAPDDPHLGQGDLRFEPRLALRDEHDGLRAIETIMMGFAQRSALGLITDPGVLMIEHGYQQADAVRGLGKAQGLFFMLSASDAAGHLRVTCLSHSKPHAPLLEALKHECLTWSSGT
ncbi:MAG: peptide chain release factor N(5)-glutamine methyltransferase, partial [Betaproteobacteria bacterium]|nr:peptide chain release factor N(5)-glutamine methyltransferase [Betaproteobacteria bacterium]